MRLKRRQLIRAIGRKGEKMLIGTQITISIINFVVAVLTNPSEFDSNYEAARKLKIWRKFSGIEIGILTLAFALYSMTIFLPAGIILGVAGILVLVGAWLDDNI